MNYKNLTKKELAALYCYLLCVYLDEIPEYGTASPKWVAEFFSREQIVFKIEKVLSWMR